MANITLPTGKQRTATPCEVNGMPIDGFTMAHFGWGAAMGVLGLPWWAALGTALFWDICVERPLKDRLPQLFPNATQDTPQHVATDAAAWLLGWGIVCTLARTCPSGQDRPHGEDHG